MLDDSMMYCVMLYNLQITKISDYDMPLINQSQKTFLFNEKIPWVKKDGSERF